MQELYKQRIEREKEEILLLKQRRAQEEEEHNMIKKRFDWDQKRFDWEVEQRKEDNEFHQRRMRDQEKDN